MFFGSDRGGETAAILMCILAGARWHGIEPFEYVRQLLIALSSADIELRSLLPDIWIAAHPEPSCSIAMTRRRRPRELGSDVAPTAEPSVERVPLRPRLRGRHNRKASIERRDSGSPASFGRSSFAREWR